jgi:hypothetical protein
MPCATQLQIAAMSFTSDASHGALTKVMANSSAGALLC